MKTVGLVLGICLAFASESPSEATVPIETTGHVEQLPQPFDAHWAWVGDLTLERMALIDLDDGRFLGMINGGYGTLAPLFPKTRAEIYVPGTYYSRRSHGERTDVVEIYDATTLALHGEVVIPPKRSTSRVGQAHAALSDDDRFIAVFNWTTGTSLSIVDIENRTLAGEITTPGCSLVYSAGPRRFFSLCADGSAFVVTIDDEGHETSRSRTPPFFDPRVDPLTEKGVRWGDKWIFASFEGIAHVVDVSGAEIKVDESWPLLHDDDRAASWRIGGMQHLAVHQASGRLYSLVHRGGPDTHKAAGEEVWIYDLPSHHRTERVTLFNPGVSIMGFPIEPGRNWIWPFNQLPDWLLNTFAPANIHFIQVTQDDRPLLITASEYTGSLGLYDAKSGRFLRRVMPTGWTSDILLAPWGGQGK